LPGSTKHNHSRKSPKRKSRSSEAKADIAELVKAGVDGFILKGATFDDFLRVIRSAAESELVSPTSLTRIVKHAVTKKKQKAGRPAPR